MQGKHLGINISLQKQPPEVFFKKLFLMILQKFQENSCGGVCVMIKLQTEDLQLYYKRDYSCFPINFVKFLTTPFLQNISWQLPLNLKLLEYLYFLLLRAIVNKNKRSAQSVFTLHKKRSFPLMVSTVNVTKSPSFCGFSHF